MLTAVAAILRRQLRDVDQAFRLEEDEFAVVAPHTDAERLVTMATRVAGVITRSQGAEGPRIAIATGIVDCPDDGVSVRASARERHRGHLRGEGGRRTRSPAARAAPRPSCKIRSASYEELART